MQNYRAFLFLILLLTYSCLRSSLHENMIPSGGEAPNLIAEKVKVHFLNEFQESILMTRVEITNAIKKSLIKKKFFKTLSADSNEIWQLKTSIESLDTPIFGTDFTIKGKFKFQLLKDNKLLKEIETNEAGVATLNDALVGLERMNLANERFVQANIEKFLIELSKSNLK
jgi:hypothetical protein